MKTIIENVTATEILKKSRFIADLFYVADENEANEKLSEIKKKYYDAKHHCFAYVIGKKQDIVKSSDDGEPSGTAGHPILDILMGENLTNVIAIVTRYFGGTLLGTGGLVTMYSNAVKSALKNAKFSDIYTGFEAYIKINYDEYNKVISYINSINVANDKNTAPSFIELDKKFEEAVEIKYLINEKEYESFKTFIRDLTKGKVTLEGVENGRQYIWKNFSPYYLW